MTERINRHMNFRSALACGAVISGGLAAFRRRAQRPAINDSGRRLSLALRRQTQDRAQILSPGLTTSCRQPPMGLLMNQMPGPKVIRPSVPRDAVADHVAQGFEHSPSG
jgi:hypothetical protein